MARKRMLAASFWTDEKVGECSLMERLLFLGLISQADDEGLGRANPKLLMSLIFPYDDIRISDFTKSLEKLSSLGMILLYSVKGQSYYKVTNFSKHQCINRATPTELPRPTEADGTNVKNGTSDNDYFENHGTLTEHSLNTHGVLNAKRREEKRREEKYSSNTTISTEPKPAEPVSTPCFTLPMTGGEKFSVTEKDIEYYESLYPACDVRQEFRKMIGWLDANPAKRKTPKGIKRFINAWLAKEQDKGGALKGKSVADIIDWDEVQRLREEGFGK